MVTQAAQQNKASVIPAEWSRDQYWCAGCERPVLKSEFPENSVCCNACTDRLAGVLRHRDIEDGLSQLGHGLNEYGRGSRACRVKAASVIEKFMDLEGGDQNLAQVLHDKFTRAMDDSAVSPKEQRMWLRSIIGMIQKQELIDAAVEKNHQGVSEAELKSAAKALALELVREDPTFRHEVLRAAGLTVVEQQTDG